MWETSLSSWAQSTVQAPLAAEWSTELSTETCSYRLTTFHPPTPSGQKEKYASHQIWTLEMLWCSSKGGTINFCTKKIVVTLSSACWAEPQTYEQHKLLNCLIHALRNVSAPTNMWIGTFLWYFLTQTPSICKAFPFRRPYSGCG